MVYRFFTSRLNFVELGFCCNGPILPTIFLLPPLKSPPFLSGTIPSTCHRIPRPIASSSVHSVLGNRELLLLVTDLCWI